jgi:hypothetical protein
VTTIVKARNVVSLSLVMIMKHDVDDVDDIVGGDDKWLFWWPMTEEIRPIGVSDRRNVWRRM